MRVSPRLHRRRFGGRGGVSGCFMLLGFRLFDFRKREAAFWVESGIGEARVASLLLRASQVENLDERGHTQAVGHYDKRLVFSDTVLES